MSELEKEILDEEQEYQQEEMMVLDDTSAEMMMKQIADANKEYDRMESWYKTQLKRIKERRDGIVAWAEGCLRGYFDLVPTRDTRTQRSYQLPSGKLVLKNREPEYERQDDVLIAWLKQNAPEYIKVQEAVDWANLKKAMKTTGDSMTTEDGEIIPGITVVAREPEFHAVTK